MAAAVLSNEAVAEYLPRVYAIAAKFKGVGGAEYDDLVQEACVYVVRQVQRGKFVSNTGMRNAMRKWVRICRAKGLTNHEPSDDV